MDFINGLRGNGKNNDKGGTVHKPLVRTYMGRENNPNSTSYNGTRNK